MIGERHANRYAKGDQLLMELCGIFHADPDPCAAPSLAAAAQVDHRSSAGNAGEVSAAPLSVLKAEQVDIEMQAGPHAFHAQDRLAVFKVDGDRAGFSHELSP